MNNELSLTDTISKEIINTTIDATIDYAEIGFDEIFNGKILQEIPAISTLISIGKIGFSIKERFFVKKILIFLKEFHSNKLDASKYIEFYSMFDNDIKFRTKVTEQVIIYNDAFLNIEKSKILANLFNSYIERNFDWEYFNYLSVCLNSMNPKSFSYLKTLSKYNFIIPDNRDESIDISFERQYEDEALLYSSGVGIKTSTWSSGFKVSKLGKDLYNFGIKK